MINSKRCLSFIMTFIICLGAVSSSADSYSDIDNVLNDTAQYLYETVKKPQVGSIGGEWAVLGLARSGYEIPDEYYIDYYKTVEEYVTACGGNLHNKKFTEYSRVITALTAIGKNPSDVAGYNLLTPLGDYEKTIWQGLNGPIWALISLDSGNYDMPVNPEAKVQATREMYINRILECQLADGGWSLYGGTAAARSSDTKSDPDITGMALQALSGYRDDKRVEEAIEKALTCMSAAQSENGGFSGWGGENSESCVQMIVALCELGISIDDARFVKGVNTMLDNLMTYYTKGEGFRHIYSGAGSNLMSTEQAFYALVALKRFVNGKSSLYTITDPLTISQSNVTSADIGLPKKNADVKKRDIIYPGKTFSDISAHINQPAIEALACRNIINGKTDDSFEPDSTMTRAEFATIITRALGLISGNVASFADVSASDWFYDFVNTAYSYGIIKGVSENEFNPEGTITREEAAVMVQRAAKLCGMDTDIDAFSARDVLAGFSDYVTASDWAMPSLAFCFRDGILSDEVMDIRPREAITRAEIAQMLFNMLTEARLI